MKNHQAATVPKRRAALPAAKQGLTLAQKHGAASAELHCRVTLGNVLARMGRWPEALAEDEAAAKAAAAIRDVNVLTAVRANQAVAGWPITPRVRSRWLDVSSRYLAAWA